MNRSRKRKNECNKQFSIRLICYQSNNRNRRWCWSVCVLTHRRTYTHACKCMVLNFIVYVFFFSSIVIHTRNRRSKPNQLMCVQHRHLDVLWTHDDDGVYLIGTNSCTIYTIPHTHIYTSHNAQTVFFLYAWNRSFFCTYVSVFLLYRLQANTHTYIHTCTHAHQPHFVLNRLLACLLICLLVYSVSRVLFVLLCSCLFGNIYIYICSTYRCRYIHIQYTSLARAPKHRCAMQISS